MLSLFFCCKIISKRFGEHNKSKGYNYPVMYPKRIESAIFDQYEILIATIKSFSSINFDIAIFNIDMDEMNEELKNEIREIININIKANEIIINLSRPSTVEGWIKNIRDASKKIKRNRPVLVVMNHDHPFIDYETKIFVSVIEKIFNKSSNNFGKAFYYSHAPEVISWAVNGRHSLKFKIQSDGTYVSGVMDNWIDSICVMTIDTLEHIWMNAKFDGLYIGRFDWPEVTYSNLGLVFYVYPREFFKHYDGYGHITGIRLISEFNGIENLRLYYPGTDNLNKTAEFYYQRWLDCFIITLREKIKGRNVIDSTVKNSYVKAIEDSLEIFKVGYLDSDRKLGLINDEEIRIVEDKLRSHIYHLGNDIYYSLMVEIELMEEIKIKDNLAFIKKHIPEDLKKILRYLRRIINNSN